MQKHQKNAINYNNFITKYYQYNFKKNNFFFSESLIIKTHFNLIKKIKLFNLIFKIIIWYRINKINKLKIFNDQEVKTFILKTKKISKKKFKNKYFQKLYEKLYLYFKSNKYRFLKKKPNMNNKMFFKEQKNVKFFKKSNYTNKKKHPSKRIIKLRKNRLWFLRLSKKKKLKIPKWKFDKLYFFKNYFFNFSTKQNIKKTNISSIKLTDYSLRTKFKSSVNLENTKTYYGVIHIKPSGANIFITLTNYTGNVFLHYLLVFLMK